MNQERQDLGETRISQIGGALGEKMIAEMTRFHPRYAAYIKDNVAVLQTSPILTQRERDGTDHDGGVSGAGAQHRQGDAGGRGFHP